MKKLGTIVNVGVIVSSLVLGLVSKYVKIDSTLIIGVATIYLLAIFPISFTLSGFIDSIYKAPIWKINLIGSLALLIFVFMLIINESALIYVPIYGVMYLVAYYLTKYLNK